MTVGALEPERTATSFPSSVGTSVPLEPGPPAPRRSLVVGWAIEVLGVLAAPVAIFYGLRVRAMSPPDMVDPWFYTAYATHPRDLMFRYGPQYYFWVRLGAIIPERVSSALFGPVAGFYVLREVLAVLAAGSAYVLLRRLHSRGAGAVAAALMLTSPVLLAAWGTDYPDAVAVSCLAAAGALAAMPTSDDRRWVWLVASACFGGVAVHCQVVSFPLVLAVFVAHVVIHRRGGIVDLIRAANIFLGVLVAETFVLSIVAGLWLGQYDILRPTFNQLAETQRLAHTPNLLHTEGFAWILHEPYLLVPPAVLLLWVVVWSSSRDEVQPAEHVVAWNAGLQWAFCVVLQFSGREPVLEYHLYSSMLWPSTLLLLGVTVTRWGARSAGLRRSRDDVALGALALGVVGVPLIAGFLPRVGTISWFPTGAVLVTVAVLVMVAITRGEEARAPARAFGAVVVLALLFPLSVARTSPDPGRHAALPRGQYDRVFAVDAGSQVAWYGALTRIPAMVGLASGPGAPALYTWSAPGSPGLSWASGQYLWHKHSISSRLPVLRRSDLTRLVRARPPELLLMGGSAEPFPAAVEALRRARMRPVFVRRGTIVVGPVRIELELLRLERFTSSRP